MSRATTSNSGDAPAKLSKRIPVASMGADPGACRREMQLFSPRSDGTRVLILGRRRSARRAAGLAETGAEFLASWRGGGDRATPLIDTRGTAIDLGGQRLSFAGAARRATLRADPWWTISPLPSGSVTKVELERPGPTMVRNRRSKTFATLRAHVTDGGTTAIVVAGKGTAQRVCERLADAGGTVWPGPNRCDTGTGPGVGIPRHPPRRTGARGAAGDRHRNRPRQERASPAYATAVSWPTPQPG